jgi:hypothetical protein
MENKLSWKHPSNTIKEESYSLVILIYTTPLLVRRLGELPALADFSSDMQEISDPNSYWN